MEQHEQISSQLITIRDYLRYAVSRFHEAGLFYGHGTDNAWDEALQLVISGLHLPQDIRGEILDARLLPEERLRLLGLFEMRVTDRRPVPYLTGRAWFAGFEFSIDERVIIPRSPIAELIENQYRPWVGEDAVKRVLDLCCGSGCIGIASAHYLPEAEVDVVDISEEALAVAQLNIEEHGLLDRVFPMHSDLFDSIPGGTHYDLIVSNPPYVDQEDLETMPAEFQHEPTLALAAGEDGLDLVRRILDQAADYLSPHGVLIVEVGNSCLALEAAYPDLPFTWLEFHRGGLGVFALTREQLLAWRQQRV